MVFIALFLKMDVMLTDEGIYCTHRIVAKPVPDGSFHENGLILQARGPCEAHKGP
jgi:hypothetical protein